MGRVNTLEEIKAIEEGFSRILDVKNVLSSSLNTIQQREVSDPAQKE